MFKWWSVNPGLKVLSFITAFLLWFHVITEREYEKPIQVPIKCINQGEHILVTKSAPEFVSTKIRGKGKELLRFGRSPKIVLNLGKLELGWQRIDLKKEDIVFPYESKIEIVSEPDPKSFIIRLERKVTKRVRVVPKLKVASATGSEYKFKVIPETIEISGGSNVYNISTITTELCSLQGEPPETLKVKLGLSEGIGAERDSVLIILLPQ